MGGGGGGVKTNIYEMILKKDEITLITGKHENLDVSVSIKHKCMQCLPQD